MVQQNAQHRQANSALRAECDTLRRRLEEKCGELRVLESDHEATSLVMSDTIESLASDVQQRDGTIADNKRKIASLEAVVDERARTIDNISGRLEQLSAQCAQLEREKAELNERCQSLQSEILRLRIVTIENDVLRNKIELVERDCATRVQSITRQSNAYVEQVNNESQARIDAMTNQHELEKRHILELADIRIRKEKEDSDQRLAGLREENALLWENRLFMANARR